jgi:predicted nucleic acid-binding protein
MILLDTNIFIEIFKGNADVTQSVRNIINEDPALSSVTAMELYYGAWNKLELQRIRKHLAAFHICHISIGISETATSLIERYAKSHGIQIPDALIAATALELKCPLLTLNTKDFQFIENLQLVPSK